MPASQAENSTFEAAAPAGLLQSSPSTKWVWAVILLGAALRVIELGRKSFWLDEIASVTIARLPVAAFWSMLWREEGNMGLYYVALRPWLHFGITEAAIRTLSALLGIASIPFIYVVARLLLSHRTAQLATVFFALNACAVTISQEARGYGLLILAILISTWLFVRLIEQPSYRWAIAYGIVTAVVLYCHYFGLFVPVAQMISVAALPRTQRPWKPLALAAFIIAGAALPVLWMIRMQPIGHITWVNGPSWLELYRLGAYLAAGSGKAVGALLLALDLMLLALFLRALKACWRDREHDLRCWRYLLLVSLLLTPVIISLLISLVRPIFYHRFLVIGLPAWVLMTAAGAEQIRSRAWRFSVVAAVCGLSLVSVLTSYPRVQEDWRGVSRYLISQASSSDRVLYYRPEGYFAVENYRNWLPGGDVSRPQGIMVNPDDADWSKQIAGAPRVWLVLYRTSMNDPLTREIAARLNGGYKLQHELPFRAVTVLEYDTLR